MSAPATLQRREIRIANGIVTRISVPPAEPDYASVTHGASATGAANTAHNAKARDGRRPGHWRNLPADPQQANPEGDSGSAGPIDHLGSRQCRGIQAGDPLHGSPTGAPGTAREGSRRSRDTGANPRPPGPQPTAPQTGPPAGPRRSRIRDQRNRPAFPAAVAADRPPDTPSALPRVPDPAQPHTTARSLTAPEAR